MHRRILGAICVFVAGLLSLAVAAPGQVPPVPAVLGPMIYRLDLDATFERGCFPPCLCPVFFSGPVRGTMLLTPIVPTTANIFDYRVEDVNWMAVTGNIEWRITGSGVLHRLGAPAIGAQRLELDLKVGDDPVEHFDSGWVLPSATFPHLSLSVSIHGGFCNDTVINVNATPVPANQLLNERLVADSQYITGCYPPCLCPISMKPLGGSLTLVPMLSANPTTLTPVEFAVASARLATLSTAVSSNAISRTTYRGTGFYSRNLPSPAGNVPSGQRMFLDLRQGNTSESQRYDSGVVMKSVPWPSLDIALSRNGMMCFDTVFHIHAVPRNAKP